MKILIGSTNLGKIREISEVLAEFGLDATTPSDLKLKVDIVEDGRTFEENAIKKARAYAEAAHMPAIADDGGLEIDALAGEPGVVSRRWPGHEATDEELIQFTLKKLEGVSSEKRGAQLRMVLAYVEPQGQVITETAAIRGVITTKPARKHEPGYPFRAIFWIPELKKFYCDLTPEEHERFNHRKQALRKLLEKISAPKKS